ncbi:MAG: thiol-disulfide oxidoreductase DCC family protein [Acidimicrobiales bacterium]
MQPVLVFDGDCGFCTSSARWAAKGWTGDARAVAWQHLGPDGLVRLGLTVAQAQAAAWWVDESGAVFRGHRAIGKSLLACRGWRRAAGALVLTPPLGWVAAGVYRLVVRYRHWLPGSTEASKSQAATRR